MADKKTALEIAGEVALITNSVIASLQALGIDINNPCNADALADKVTDFISKWKDNVNEVVDELSFELGGSYFVTFAVLIAAVLGESALAVIDSFLSEMVFGNFVNGLASAVTFMFSLIPIAELILEYYLIKTLREDLYRRRQLGIILQSQLGNLIQLFEAFYGMFKLDTKTSKTNLKLALKELQRAESILVAEMNKKSSDNVPASLNVGRIQAADMKLDEVLDYLTEDDFSGIKHEIQKLHANFNIQTELPDSFNISGWIKYFESLGGEIKKRFFAANGELDAKQKIQEYRVFLDSLVPVLPGILQRLIMQELFNSSSSIVMEKMPVGMMNFKAMKDFKSALDSSTVLPANVLKDLFGQNGKVSQEYDFFKNPATKDITYKNITTKTKLEEAGLLLFPNYWSMVNTASDMLRFLLMPTIEILKNVETDMKDTITDTTIGPTELIGIKLKWSSEIIGAKAFLKGLTGTTRLSIGGKQYSTNPAELTELISSSAEISKKITSCIIDKTYDTKRDRVVIEHADVAYSIAQKYLAPLITNMYVVFSPNTAKSVLVGLHGLNTALGKQNETDLREYELCDRFINNAESRKAFTMWKDLMDNLLNSLGDKNKDLADSLKSGSLAPLVDMLEGIEAADNIAQLITCSSKGKEKAMDYVDTLVQWFAVDTKYKEKEIDVQRIRRSMDGLKEQKMIFLNMIGEVMENISALDSFKTEGVE